MPHQLKDEQRSLDRTDYASATFILMYSRNEGKPSPNMGICMQTIICKHLDLAQPHE